jgi:hypothetical protein
MQAVGARVPPVQIAVRGDNPAPDVDIAKPVLCGMKTQLVIQPLHYTVLPVQLRVFLPDVIIRRQNTDHINRGVRRSLFDTPDNRINVLLDHLDRYILGNIIDADLQEQFTRLPRYHLSQPVKHPKAVVSRNTPVHCCRITGQFFPVPELRDAVAQEYEPPVIIGSAAKTFNRSA